MEDHEPTVARGMSPTTGPFADVSFPCCEGDRRWHPRRVDPDKVDEQISNHQSWVKGHARLMKDLGRADS